MIKNGRYDQRVIMNAVAKVVPAIKDAEVLYDIDCRDWLPKGLSYIEGMHTGCHPALFNRVVRHDGFAGTLLAIRGQLTDDMEMSRTTVSVLMCDDAGRHASMSVAKALAECIAFDVRFALGSVHILADQHSEAYCGVCARCEFWTRRWISRNTAVKQVKELWFGPAE